MESQIIRFQVGMLWDAKFIQKLTVTVAAASIPACKFRCFHDATCYFSSERARSVRQYGLTANQNPVGGEGGMRQVSNLWTKRSFAKLSTSSLMVAALAFIGVIGAPAQAQNDKMTPIATPSQPNAIEIGTGPLPAAQNPESWHTQY